MRGSQEPWSHLIRPKHPRKGVGTMADDSGLMPETFIDRPGPQFVETKVKDLEPEHGECFIGVGDVAVDVNRKCWVWLDAPVFSAAYRDVAPIVIRRTRDAGYEVQMGGLPVE